VTSPPVPQCAGPEVQSYAREAVRPGAWVAYDYYLAEGSEWNYVAAASELVTVLHMKVCAERSTHLSARAAMSFERPPPAQV
jgi:hypothetical protein